MMRTIATIKKRPTPIEATATKTQSGPSGLIREARTLKSGSANVHKKPTKTATIKRATRLFLFVIFVPTISPILATDFSAPILNKAVPTIKGRMEIRSDVMTGPNFDPSVSNDKEGTQKTKRIKTTITGNIASSSSLNLLCSSLSI